MLKIVHPCMCEVGGVTKARAFAKIEFDGKRLSISGVVGPLRNGDCRGGCGQCIDEIRLGEPAQLWTSEMLEKFCDIWERWHLNDLRAACEHQRELGWELEAREKISHYHYRLTEEAGKAQKKAKEAALDALRKGETFTPTDEQVFFANLSYGIDTYDEIPEELAPHYQAKKPMYDGDYGFEQKERRGHVQYENCDRGILGKPCPVCGYKYGTAWLTEEVPQEVIDWLFSLPDTPVTPSWV